MEPRIRLATMADAPAIAEIYNQAIALRSATADLSPVSAGERGDWLAGHDSARYPVYVAETGTGVMAWCSVSAYRPGRMALRHTAEVSYYVHEQARGVGLASALIAHVIKQCPNLGLKTLFAILLDVNTDSVRLLEKFGFERWGQLPKVADFDGRECGHLYFGLRVVD